MVKSCEVRSRELGTTAEEIDHLNLRQISWNSSWHIVEVPQMLAI